MKRKLGNLALACFLGAIGVMAGPSVSPGAPRPQKNKKPDDASSQALPALPTPDSQQIDHAVGEMLGAFQVGDVEAMHKYYADNVTFVRGTYDPPLVGWQNYVKLYEGQKAAFQAMQLVRRDTFIFVHQDVSWVSYQWEFIATFNGKPFDTRGQTTLVLNKVGNNWLIVHNHTSEICPEAAAPAATSSMQTAPQSSPQSALGKP